MPSAHTPATNSHSMRLEGRGCECDGRHCPRNEDKEAINGMVRYPCDQVGHLRSHCARVPRLMATAKPLQRRISDSPHRSGDCITTIWWWGSLTVLKHPRYGQPHSYMVRYPCVLRSGISLSARVPRLMATAKPLQRRIGDSLHRSGDCITTTWWRGSFTVLKHPRYGQPHASMVRYPCSDWASLWA